MYHISRHYISQSTVFTPRIPVSQHESEIGMPARVCASNTLEGCWNAINCCQDLISEMRKNHTTGYYFFVYKMDASSFQASNVFDAEKTGEMISYEAVKGDLVSAFYVSKYKLNYPFSKAAEEASIEEAIAAYAEWQKEDLSKIEATVASMPW